MTGGIKESNAGGTVARSLASLGIGALVLEGALPLGELSVVHVNSEGEARIIPTAQNKGLRTYKLVEKLLEEFGPKQSVLCIGPAGESMLPIASIQSSDTEDRPCRAAGRGGLGAVMGAKGIKAIVVDRSGKESSSLADSEAFAQAAKDFAKVVRDHPLSGKMLPALGTMGLVAAVNSLGAYPCYNATRGVLDGWEKISGETMAQLIQKRGGRTSHAGCSRCIIRCSNDYRDQEGKFVTASLEYETAWSLGGMTGVTDLDILAKADRLCDEIGVDTMSAGVAISVAIDAGYRKSGDGQAVLDLLEEIGQGTQFGMILGQGPSEVGRHFGHHRVPVVMNQSIAAYDPRAMQGMAVTYATSPMGADHTAGNLIGPYMARLLDPLGSEGQVEASRNSQIAAAALDCTGVCLFALAALNTPDGKQAFCQAMSAKLGHEFGPEDFVALGKKVLMMEKEFNLKAGLSPEHDRLPSFFYEEPLPPHNQVVKISREEMNRTLEI